MKLTDRNHLHALCDAVLAQTPAGLRGSLHIGAEDSTFLRFNQAKVRQATHVSQAYATLSVSDGLRSAQATLTLSGDMARDTQALAAVQLQLAQELPGLPEDPHLMLPDAIAHTVRDETGSLPSAEDVIDTVTTHAAGLDLVGFYAGGPMVRMHADSRGQRNWHRVETFAFDWCLYHLADKAVKTLYAGTHWDEAEFARRVEAGRSQLKWLAHPPMALAPGRYRAYFSPAAMAELLGTLAWGGFSHKEQALATSPLTRLAKGEVHLHPTIDLAEDTGHGSAPGFTPEGFARPDSVPLIAHGAHAAALCSARSAREYGLTSNGALAHEGPLSLRLEPGHLPDAEVLQTLGTGLYIGNLHYLNYSDRRHCRITGMTRFACFWVENGALVAPLGVMRFDDDLLAMFGTRLIALTDHAELQQDTSTYGERQLNSVTTPGALIEGFELTL
jgi:predicted Zn-dependent protease